MRRLKRWLWPLRIFGLAALTVAPLYAHDPLLQGENFDPQSGMRIGHYQSKTPSSVPGATTLDTVATEALIAHAQPVVLDVHPITEARYDELDGTWPPTDHQSIVQAVWLPNVGFGILAPDMQRYLREQLALLTQGDSKRPVLVFCQQNCWMGWNAVQHISALGYQTVYWYPLGVDGFKAAGWPLSTLIPKPVDVD